MPDWKRVKITFPTVKLGQFIEPVKRTVFEASGKDYNTVYGVTNTEGIAVTGKKASKDISNYITIDKGCFAYNPYRINVGSIGFNDSGKKGCVSPAYVVFKTRDNLNPEFLFEYLKSDFGNHLINWYGNRGGVRNALRYDDLCEIDVPQIDFQKQSFLLGRIQKAKIPIVKLDSELENQAHLLEKLRQSILQAAIEGKLTAQWRKENPKLISGENHASKLLEKIKAEKERLIKEGKIKKEKHLPLISKLKRPFDLPDEWEWCRLDDISEFINGKAHEMYVATSAKYILINSKFVSTNGKKFKNSSKALIPLCQNNIAIVMSDVPDGIALARCFLVDKDDTYTLNQRVGGILANKNIHIQYLLYLLDRNKYFLDFDDKKKQTNLKKYQILYCPIPLPSLNEQKMIVEKIQKIMTFIENLERQIAERREQSEQLMRAVLREAFEL